MIDLDDLPGDAPPHLYALASALAAFNAARDALCAASAAYAAEETRRISRRLPRRRVRWSCGMGTATLEISRRRPQSYGNPYERDKFVLGAAWAPRGAERPEFLDVLDHVENETGIADPAAGVLDFEDGESVT